MHYLIRLAGLALLAALAMPSPARAAEAYDNCTGFITSLPASISTQGTWCLNKDLNTGMTSGSAITINTNNVTIDCNDFKLGGLLAGAGTTTFGIYAANRQNITIRRCNIRGFYAGALLDSPEGGGHAIEHSRFNANTAYGMIVLGDGSRIRDNLVTDTGGNPGEVFAVGIYYGNGAILVENNQISGVSPVSGNAYGIYQDTGAEASVVRGNHVSGLMPTGEGSASGIDGWTGALFEANVVINPPSTPGQAIFAPGSSLCVGNRISGFTSLIAGGCIDGGNNLAF